jgi:hypothetical protein
VLLWKDPATDLGIYRVGAPNEGIYRLNFGRDLAVDVSPDGRIITRAAASIPQVTVDHFLADQVFPRLFAHRGDLVVHSGAIRTGRTALMVMGQSGRGKSTLTSSFDQAGFGLLGDDAMVMSSVDTGPRVRPVYPSLRLFPDSIEALMPGAETAGRVAHYSTKERIEVPIAAESDDWPLPVDAIFLIAAPAKDDEISVRRLTRAETCMALVENSFALDPANVTLARGRLEQASAFARNVPGYEITYPRDYARLPEVRQVILDQAAAMEPA